MRSFVIAFLVMMLSFVCEAQTDIVFKKDTSGLFLATYDFHTYQHYQSPSPLSNISFDWKKMSSPSHVFYDSLSIMQMQINRYKGFGKTMIFYKDRVYYFDDPLEPYGANSIPCVLIFGTINYLFQLLDWNE